MVWEAKASVATAASEPGRARTFAVAPGAGLTRRFCDGIADILERGGWARRDEPRDATWLVLYPIDAEHVRPWRRHNAATFVIAVARMDGIADLDHQQLLAAGYPLLVRALANLVVLVDGERARFVTLEQGVYGVDGRGPTFFEAAFARIEPLAASRLVIANNFEDDLDERLRDGDERSAQMLRAGRRMEQLGLLPSPFPLDRFLAPRDVRHLQLLYGIGGLSYGNCSIRRFDDTHPTDEFWMSASGVDKSSLRTIGRDILLVRRYDPERDAMVIAVPTGVTPRRVSVDAIEHWMIYRAHPEIGAILHVHGWIDGVRATEINYPCGTLELATAVADRVRAADDPAHAVVGQRNHGLTITGEDLDEIFGRVGHLISARVPMD